MSGHMVTWIPPSGHVVVVVVRPTWAIIYRGSLVAVGFVVMAMHHTHLGQRTKGQHSMVCPPPPPPCLLTMVKASHATQVLFMMMMMMYFPNVKVLLLFHFVLFCCCTWTKTSCVKGSLCTSYLLWTLSWEESQQSTFSAVWFSACNLRSGIFSLKKMCW